MKRIAGQGRSFLTGVPRSYRKKINRIRLSEIEGWMEKLQREMLELRWYGRLPENLKMEIRQPTFLSYKCYTPYAYDTYALLKKVPVAGSELNMDFMVGFRYDWDEKGKLAHGEIGRKRRTPAIIKLSEISGYNHSDHFRHLLRVDACPSKKKIRGLQALLLPLVLPLIQIRNLPVDVDYSKYLEDAPLVMGTINTRQWKKFFA